MPSFGLPSDGMMKLWRARIERARDKRENWLRETDTNKRIGNNEPGAWSEITPIQSDRSGKTALVVRNAIGQNARQEVNRLMPKEPRFFAEPLSPIVYEEMPDGTVAEQDNGRRCVVLAACSNIVANGTTFLDEGHRCGLDGEYGNKAYLKIGYMGGADVSHTAPLPFDTRSGGETADLKPAEKRAAKRGGTVHGGIKPYLPYFVRIPPDKILSDPDAVTDSEVNWYAQIVVRPLEAMKSEKLNEVDYESQTVKRRAKYSNLDKVKPNARPSDKDKPESLSRNPSDYYAEDYLEFYEVHYRVAAENPEDTKDGYEYYILSFVNHADGTVESGPVAIRHEKYAIDLGGFCIEPYTANLVNDDNLGFVPGIRDAIGPAALFNTMASQSTDWVVRNKTVRVFNKGVLQDEDAELLATAEANDWVGINLPAGARIDDVIGVVPANPLPDSLVQMQSFMLNLTNEQTGRSNNQRGDVQNVRTASEAQIVAQEANTQVAAKQRRFRIFLSNAMRKGMIIFTHVLPEQGPMQGRWMIPNPALPGRFLQFEKRDLYADAEIKLDLTSQVLRDDNVVVQQGMQLLDVLSKILMAPPEILRKLMPFVERTVAAMGPDWEAKTRDMNKPAEEASDPRNEHLLMAAGEPVVPDQNEDLMAHMEAHRSLLKVIAQAEDPQLTQLFMTPLGMEGGATITPLVLLTRHIDQTEEIATAKGLGVETGAVPKGKQGAPGGKQGSGPGSGRAPQGVPNSGELEAQAGNVENMPHAGMRGMMVPASE